MNRVYKVIYSKARQCYMVVSELAKRNQKNSQTSTKQPDINGPQDTGPGPRHHCDHRRRSPDVGERAGRQLGRGGYHARKW